MIFGVLFLLVLSTLNLYGIGGGEDSFFRRQIVLAVGALLVLYVVAHFNYRSLKNWSVPVLVLYGGALCLLILTFFFGEIRNIRAWIQLGGLRFEPSELAKYAVVILLAKYFSQRHVLIRQFRHVLISGFYAGLPAVLVLAQPDLGSATIIGVVWLVMLMASGVNWRHLFLIGIVGIVGAYMAWIWALAPYQKDRILAFIDPYQDPTGYGYHIIQSKIAIGSGGLWGRGLGQGSQSTLGFLPEPQNDFAFATFVEQFGGRRSHRGAGRPIVYHMACTVNRAECGKQLCSSLLHWRRDGYWSPQHHQRRCKYWSFAYYGYSHVIAFLWRKSSFFSGRGPRFCTKYQETWLILP